MSDIRKCRNLKAALTSLVACGLVSTALTGCGKTAYEVSSSTQSQQAPGTYAIPPKVDILITEPDNGAAFESYAQLSSDLQRFVSQLDSENWNYHFAVTPLTTPRAMNQVMGSHYDRNWLNQPGGGWIAPYPGALNVDLSDTIFPGVFRTLQNFGAFVQATDLSTQLAGVEPGLNTISDALLNQAQALNFMRKDATLVVIALTGGEDTSNTALCDYNGFSLPCDGKPASLGYQPGNTSFMGHAVTCGTNGKSVSASNPCSSSSASLASYESALSSLRGVSTSQILFYAGAYESCSNSHFQGLRYAAVASSFGGQTYDLCTQSVTAALSGIASNLNTVRLSYKTNYLFISQQPDLSTVVVTKYLGGDPNQAVTLPQDPNNGWTYAGYLQNQNTLFYPVPGNQETGYAFKLSGSAILQGNDTANVSYLPNGAQNSAK